MLSQGIMVMPRAIATGVCGLVLTAAVVREAVATYLPTKKKKIDWRKHPSFGSWKPPRGFDSVEYVRKLRAEWDHRG